MIVLLRVKIYIYLYATVIYLRASCYIYLYILVYLSYTLSITYYVHTISLIH